MSLSKVEEGVPCKAEIERNKGRETVMDKEKVKDSQKQKRMSISSNKIILSGEGERKSMEGRESIYVQIRESSMTHFKP
jgi:hypothetical protein